MRFATLLIVVSGAAFPLLSQVTIMGAGYTTPSPMTVAPGQVVTIFAADPGSTILPHPQAISASGLPLPTELAGFSVWLRQILPETPLSVPLFSVSRPERIGCPFDWIFPCTPVIALTVQIPYELIANNPGTGINVASLHITKNGLPGGAIALYPVPDQIHVVSRPAQGGVQVPAVPVPAVTHADGSLLTPDSPARPGEAVTMYVLGLGYTNPLAPTGKAAPGAFPPANTPRLSYDFRPNASPSPGDPQSGARRILPLYVGLTPTAVGLYQVNFVVPEPPVGTTPCAGQVLSNLTVTLAGVSSFDGARICVAIPAAAPAP